MKILFMQGSLQGLEKIRVYLPAATVHFVSDFNALQEALGVGEYDSIIMDVSSIDYYTVKPVEILKARNKRVGLILLSEEDNLRQKIDALKAGADDYMVCPFDVSELAARIISLSRRVNLLRADDLLFDEIRVDRNARMVYVNDQVIELTRKEMELLQYFISHKNTVVKKEALGLFLSGQSTDMIEAADLIYAHVKNLKKKLRQAGCKTYLKTVYGMGYRWENN